MEELIISVKGRDEPENAYSETGNSVVDRLLLRYLPSCELGSMRQQIIAHLIVGNRLSKLFDESHHLFGVLTLIYEPNSCAF